MPISSDLRNLFKTIIPIGSYLDNVLEQADSLGCEMRAIETPILAAADPLSTNIELKIRLFTKTFTVILYNYMDIDYANRIADRILTFLRTVLGVSSPLKTYDPIEQLVTMVKNELSSRGDFEIDVVRLVDILLQLKIAKPKED